MRTKVAPEAKQQVQGAFFDIMIAAGAQVGDVVDISLGLMYMALINVHQGDSFKVASDIRQAMEKACENILTPPKAPLAMVPGGKLDS
jgi:hypothetical protein